MRSFSALTFLFLVILTIGCLFANSFVLGTNEAIPDVEPSIAPQSSDDLMLEPPFVPKDIYDDDDDVPSPAESPVLAPTAPPPMKKDGRKIFY
ncbi:hypothetical protein vseg_013867 [Gypsophila vaccaria]